MQQGLGERTTAHVLPERKRGFYERYIKRLLDIICSLAAIVVFGWLGMVGLFEGYKEERQGHNKADEKSLSPSVVKIGAICLLYFHCEYTKRTPFPLSIC